MAQRKSGSADAVNDTVVERRSDLEFAVTRRFAAPARIVFEAWSNPDLFTQWWIPKSGGMTLLSCEMDVRTGGTYRLVFSHPAFDQPMAFFGTYQEVTRHTRIVWSNEESGDQGAVTTVTFDEDGDTTVVIYHERYRTKAALDDALASSAEALPEQFAQLDAWLAARP